jgi:hypothetical protein
MQFVSRATVTTLEKLLVMRFCFYGRISACNEICLQSIAVYGDDVIRVHHLRKYLRDMENCLTDLRYDHDTREPRTSGTAVSAKCDELILEN